ncbi:SIR2 family protein [Pseudoalteromonas xiamenensis]
MASLADYQAELTQLLKDKQLVPLVGAGVSMSIKDINNNPVFPNWVKLLNDAANEIKDQEDKNYCEYLVKRARLLEAANEIKRFLHGEKWYAFLKSQFNPDLKKCDPNSFDLPRAIWKLSSQIITLNYDKVLSHTAPVGNVTTIKNSSPANISTMLTPNDAYMAWHLHGHIDEPENMVLTAGSYHQLYDSNEQLQAALEGLKSIVTQRSLLFIGCSLDDANLLQKLAEQHALFNNNTCTHYALVHQSEYSQIENKLNDIKNMVLIEFADFGKPLVDLVEQISAFNQPKVAARDSAPHTPTATTITTTTEPKIAYLWADPLDAKANIAINFKALEKTLCKRMHFNTTRQVLTVDALQDMCDSDYLVLACRIIDDQLIIENQYGAAQPIDFAEFESNLMLEAIKGVIVICDALPSHAALAHAKLPYLFIPELIGKHTLLDKLWFNLFKKQSFNLFEKNGRLHNIHSFDVGKAPKKLNNVTIGNPALELPNSISALNAAQFIGRERDLIGCSEQLETARLNQQCLTLVAQGGAGKTEFAQKLAVEYNRRTLFSQPITFINCEYLETYQQFHRQVAGAFKLEEALNLLDNLPPTTDPSARLIIIDNAESLLLLDDKAQILKFIAAISAFATLLITSREALGIDNECVFNLATFSNDEALTLFSRNYAGALSEQDNTLLTNHILPEQLGNNPLAISLVASTLLSADNLLDLHAQLKTNLFDIAQKRSDLAPGEPIDDLTRHESVFVSIDYSYRALKPHQQDAFKKLAFFPDGLDLRAFTQHKNKQTRLPIKIETLNTLKAKSLLSQNEHWVRLHPLIAEFARKKITPIDEAAFLPALFAHHCEFAHKLHDMSFDTNLSKQLRAGLMQEQQLANSCIMIERLTPNLGLEQVADYIFSIYGNFSSIGADKEIITSLEKCLPQFIEHQEVCIFLEISKLSALYNSGQFDHAYQQLQATFPLDTELNPNDQKRLQQHSFNRASNVYDNEGESLSCALIDLKIQSLYRKYSHTFYTLGFLNLEWAGAAIKTSETIAVKMALGQCTLHELQLVLDHTHPKDHIQRARLLGYKAKFTTVSQSDIDSIVVVNPYTQGMKLVLQSYLASTAEQQYALYQQALPHLEHIKFAYTEILLEFATWLQAQEQYEAEFNTIFDKGLTLAKRYHFRFLQHGFLQLKAINPTPYNEADYPLPDGIDFSDYIQKLIKYCKRANNH